MRGRPIFSIFKPLRRYAVAALTLCLVSTGGAIAALAQSAETAALAPRTDAVSIPKVLSEADADRYAQVFDLQREGKWTAADKLIKQIESDILMGHVLYQRYMHPTAYRSKFAELRDWMKAYADHPGADRIYKLAKRRKPRGAKTPPAPRAVSLPDLDAVEAPAQDLARDTGPKSRKYEGKTGWERSKIRGEQRQIRRWVQRGAVTKALEYLSSSRLKNLFDDVSYAESLGVIARGYYRYHYDDKAMEVASLAEERAGDGAALAHWWGGLAAFRAGDSERAANHFEQLSRSVEAGEWLQAAGGFWASRSYLRGGIPTRVTEMLGRAAAHPRTFYGLLANRALGEKAPLNFHLPVLGETDSEFLLRIPAARRSLALIEAGQTDLADTELRRFVNALPPSFAATLLAFADRAGLADVAFRMGNDIQRRQGVFLDGALYPLPGWAPAEGYKIDRALIFAIIRQESQFRTRATSRAGARGLMQLMPATAGYMSGNRFRGAAKAKLYDPSLNLTLGQKYIQYVLDLKDVDGNLLRALTAYNAGPGNLQRWSEKIDYAGDPLLFIESLPSRETRKYIEFVLSNYWIYRLRMDQDLVSMDQLLGGLWPSYIAQESLGGDETLTAVSVE